MIIIVVLCLIILIFVFRKKSPLWRGGGGKTYYLYFSKSKISGLRELVGTERRLALLYEEFKNGKCKFNVLLDLYRENKEINSFYKVYESNRGLPINCGRGESLTYCLKWNLLSGIIGFKGIAKNKPSFGVPSFLGSNCFENCGDFAKDNFYMGDSLYWNMKDTRQLNIYGDFLTKTELGEVVELIKNKKNTLKFKIHFYCSYVEDIPGLCCVNKKKYLLVQSFRRLFLKPDNNGDIKLSGYLCENYQMVKMLAENIFGDLNIYLTNIVFELFTQLNGTQITPELIMKLTDDMVENVEKSTTIVKNDNPRRFQDEIKKIKWPNVLAGKCVLTEKKEKNLIKLRLPHNCDVNYDITKIECLNVNCFYGIINIVDKGNQWATPKEYFKKFKEKYDSKFELFASPFNCYHDNFGSVFYEFDKYFGSLGSAFDICDFYMGGAGGDVDVAKLKEFEQNLVFTANPPFMVTIMDKLWKKLDELLNKRECTVYVQIPYKYYRYIMRNLELRKFYICGEWINSFVDYYTNTLRNFGKVNKKLEDLDTLKDINPGTGFILSSDKKLLEKAKFKF